MNIITLNPPTNQAFSKKDFLRSEWQRDPVAFFSQWQHKGLARVVNYLAGLGNNFEKIYPTQSRIGDRADITRVHTNRLIQRLEQEGILQKHYRYRKSCVYTLHPLFDYVPFRRKLQELMPSFWYLPLSLMFALYAPKTPSVRDYVTQISYQSYVYKSLKADSLDRGWLCTDTRATKPPNRKKSYNLYWDFPERRQMSTEAVERLFSKQLRRAADALHLTTAGMIWLSSYPEDVLAEAIDKYEATNVVIHKPYQWFDRLCKNFCQERNITPLYSHAQFLSQELQVPLVGVPYVRVEGKIPRQPQARTQPDTTSTSAAPKSYKKNIQKSHKREYVPPLTPRASQPTAPTRQRSVWRDTTPEERAIWNEKMKQISPESRAFMEKMGITIPEAPRRFTGDPNGGIRRIAPPRYKVYDNDPIDTSHANENDLNWEF